MKKMVPITYNITIASLLGNQYSGLDRVQQVVILYIYLVRKHEQLCSLLVRGPVCLNSQTHKYLYSPRVRL